MREGGGVFFMPGVIVALTAGLSGRSPADDETGRHPGASRGAAAEAALSTLAVPQSRRTLTNAGRSVLRLWAGGAPEARCWFL